MYQIVFKIYKSVDVISEKYSFFIIIRKNNSLLRCCNFLKPATSVHCHTYIKVSCKF